MARPLSASIALLIGALTVAREAAADEPFNVPRVVEPWSDADPPTEPNRYALGDFGFRAAAEYRAMAVTVNPMSLGTEDDKAVSWIEHRLRLDGTADYLDKVRIVTSADLLDGVVWGDNGDFGGTPASNAGANVSAKNPNVTRPCVALRQGADPLDSASYGYGICPADTFKLRRLYGEVVLPFGLLRVGRQAVNLGTGVQNADGEGRPNRFGISRTGNVVDRILFATKPLEGLKPAAARDTSANRGLILALAYDRIVTDSPSDFGANVHQWDTAVRFLAPKHALGTDLLVAAYHAYRWDSQYSTRINSFGFRAMSRFGALYAGLDGTMNVGTTREVALAYGAITGDPAVDQTVRQLGARAVVRYDQPMWSAYLEGDYASGDEDPQVRTPLTQFVFAEDANVGLLLFKHTLAFQTARAAASGVETLRRLGATTYPAEAISTRGAFTNAMALFPQIDFRPHPALLLRGGVLMAWAPARVVDPVGSLKRKDGLTIEDDLVNYAGGKPGRYYGTEIDGRIQYRFMEHFAFDLEGAILFPGDALQNVDGYAVRSVLVQARTTFFF